MPSRDVSGWQVTSDMTGRQERTPDDGDAEGRERDDLPEDLGAQWAELTRRVDEHLKRLGRA
ncbi:hypothetical protein CAG99_10780 [Streptomyces marincola]|uniref:Uncharacterized protein n=1 Tax=Streptomyces marincola TaxID=2878388 RepID=A0A1W7CX57_9ACTN|nr:hypothetical protein CAG99_10780 [Streptomyces marincola]